MNVWGIDISNWNGEVTPQNLIDWKAAGVSVCMIRASRESPALAAIAKQQFTVTKPVVQTTLPYGWCYGNDVPEKMVQETINLCDGLTTEKKLVFDVEDITNFIAEFGKFRPSLALPKRYQATISAMQGGLHIGFSSLLPTVAVSWLQSAFIEANKLGYEPCIYSAAWCWNPLTGSSTAFSKAKWLVAQFDQIANLTIFGPVGGVQALMGKQYSDTGTIPFNDPNSPSYDFSIWDPTMLMSTPVVTTGGPDIPDAQDRLNTLDQMIDSDAATLHTWIDGVRQDLRSLGAAK